MCIDQVYKESLSKILEHGHTNQWWRNALEGALLELWPQPTFIL